MVNHAFMFLENPLFVFDADFMLTAANWEELEKHPRANKYIEQTGLTNEAFPLLDNYDHIHKRVLKSEEPIHVMHPEIGVEQIVCAINTKRDLGHIVLCALNRPFRDYDNHAVKLLAAAINDQLQKDTFVRYNQGFNYEQFIADLLDGKIATNRQFQDRLSYVNIAFSRYNYCLIADLARNTKTIHPAHIRDTFEKILPSSRALIYNGELVVIISKEAGPLIDAEMGLINKASKQYGIYCGLSNSFSDIMEIKNYYEQALRAIELGINTKDSPNLFRYYDYAIDHIKFVFGNNVNIEAFVHPFIRILEAYDKIHKTSFVRTWYMYLIHERNLVATADAMFLHRNTLAYHLKKINAMAEEGSFQFDSAKERAYYTLSYDLLKDVFLGRMV